MRNRKLSILLSVLSLHQANGLTEYEKIKLDDYFENQKKEIDEKTKKLALQKRDRNDKKKEWKVK